VSTTKVVPIRLSPAERRQRVEVGVRARKSNRAIGTELGVDEGTVRRDRKYLARPEDERPVRVLRPKKERPIRELSLDESRRRHQQSLLKAAQLWITQRASSYRTLIYLSFLIAGKLLHHHRHSLNERPEPVKSPDELLSLTRPTYAVEEYMPAKLGFYAEWFARWLACCLPREEELQDELLRQISIRARS